MGSHSGALYSSSQASCSCDTYVVDSIVGGGSSGSEYSWYKSFCSISLFFIHKLKYSFLIKNESKVPASLELFFYSFQQNIEQQC